MKIIGLCGGSGSGKGAVSEIFRELGVPSVDADAVYREITSRPSECLAQLAREFGDGVIKNGALDRDYLRGVIFTPPGVAQRQARLNAITHKYVVAEMKRRIEWHRLTGVCGVILDAPLLFESGLDGICDTLIAVVADRELRIARIITRDGITLTAAEQRLAAQKPDAELISICHHIIVNNGTLDELTLSVRGVYQKIFET